MSKVSTLALVLLLIAPALKAQNYGQKLNHQWKQILSLPKSAGDYQWFGYPVDNFGVITMYGPPAGSKLTDSDRLCATWSCMGIDKIPTDDSAFITVNGYADAGKGPAIHLTSDRNGKIAVSLILSNLLAAIGINASASISNDVTVDLTADAIYRRSVDQLKLTHYISNTPTNGLLYTFWHSGQLSFIGADVVAQNVVITLTVNPSRSVDLNAALSKAIGQVGSGSKAEVDISSSAKDTYTIKFPGFLILATQLHHQFGPGLLFGSTHENPNAQLEQATRTTPKPSVDSKTLMIKETSLSQQINKR